MYAEIEYVSIRICILQKIEYAYAIGSAPGITLLCSVVAVGCAAVLETGPLPPQDHKSGTVCRPISDYLGCHTASSGSY